MLRKRPTPAPGWYRDPLRRHQFREWDGERWTPYVSDNGRASVDYVDMRRARRSRLWKPPSLVSH
jgi:hypothetical protein